MGMHRLYDIRSLIMMMYVVHSVGRIGNSNGRFPIASPSVLGGNGMESTLI